MAHFETLTHTVHVQIKGMLASYSESETPDPLSALSTKLRAELAAACVKPDADVDVIRTNLMRVCALFITTKG